VPGVYISYPFCAQKCTYCNFASGVFPRSLEDRYRLALAAEIRDHAWQWQPETVYLGGGTPSSLQPEELASFLKFIPGGPWLEATIEASPGTITPEKARGWASLGIGRVSLGVQSFVEKEIRRTGRKHTPEIVAAELATLRDAGIRNCNLDLIAGLSGQTAASWRESLDWIERLAPPHVSVYMLEVDEDSRLGKERLLGGVRYGAADVPSDDQTADSFDGILRRQNPESVEAYLAAPRSGPAEPSDAVHERFFLGLRLMEGVRPSPEEWVRFAQSIRRGMAQGLLETAGGMLRLTPRGVMLSNEVFQEFLPL
jgi:oxygen-independent coproporphyrinogen-3 oxidase